MENAVVAVEESCVLYVKSGTVLIISSGRVLVLIVCVFTIISQSAPLGLAVEMN